MRRLLLAMAFSLAPAPRAGAQELTDQITVIDSIAVEGLRRVSRASVVATANIPLGEPISFRDVQRAMERLFATRQFDDVRVYQGTIDGREVLRFSLVERPLLTGWTVRGVEKLSERKVRGRIRLLDGRPYDRALAAQSRAAIDSLYEHEGYYATNVELRELRQDDETMRVVFDVAEGRRVTVSQVVVEGNQRFSDGDVVGAMKTKPEGFWWWRKGTYNEDALERDIRERLPSFYGKRGHIDFQVLGDSLVVTEGTGKGTLMLTVDEGREYEVGTFEIVGNRYFSTEQLALFYPFRHGSGFLGSGGGRRKTVAFNQAKWEEATLNVETLYRNNGYLYAQITPAMNRRTTADGRNVVDLRWQIIERQPAIVNKVLIRGNAVTHEDVIRRAIVMVPGDVLRQDALIRSYQNISNLNFFEQPLRPPTTEQANQQGDLDVIFHVEDKHTGNINFGASVGQGTGLGGFIGLNEPNLFGRGKQVAIQWQFGRHINDISLSYTDPAIQGSLVSGTIALHNRRLRYTVADLGRIRSRGGRLQVGFPVRGSRYTRLFLSYTLDQSEFDSPTLAPRFTCENCILSSIGVDLVRDTRIDLPFPSAGVLHRFSLSQSGGEVLRGSGDFRRATFEGRWYTPLAHLGGDDPLSSPMKLVLGFSAQMGFVWGDPGPHFRQLFAMGGTQFGIPLRGYDEFSITPLGFDSLASGRSARTVDAFGRSYFAMTAEVGFRLSQAIYFNVFSDAGRVWAAPAQFNPTQLFRSAGVGLSLITPLGPIGLDYAYGFDRIDPQGNPDPWKFHFKLGQFF